MVVFTKQKHPGATGGGKCNDKCPHRFLPRWFGGEESYTLMLAQAMKRRG
jgi:hypothetical protein